MEPETRDIEDECPICHNALPKTFDGTNAAGEAHIASCINSRVPNAPTEQEEVDSEPSEDHSRPQETPKGHISTCFELPSSSSPENINRQVPADDRSTSLTNSKTAQKSPKTPTTNMDDSKPPQSSSSTIATEKKLEQTMLQKEAGEVTALRRWFSKLGGESKTPQQKKELILAKGDELMHKRWGPPGSPTYELVMKYWVSTRMQKHWDFLHGQHPRQFRKKLERGYMEPIPTSWIQSRYLAYPLPEGFFYENEGEKRLYYFLNSGTMPDGSRHPTLRPLNIVRDRNTIIRRGNARNARQVHLDAKKVAAYKSTGDVFQSDKQIKSHSYSDQVPNTIYAARTQALHELADGILHGTDHLETMLLIDVSGSMTWNPHSGILGPDGITRYHDQPSNIALVQHLVHRCLHHMIPRAQKAHPSQTGIDTVTFSSYGVSIGPLTTTTFAHDWNSKVHLGGGTQVMQGWQVVKKTYFEHQHHAAGHGRYDPVFGWQPTPGMPKLSLLVFLDGEATDMDEFELEVLGETWAYVTIALVGMENCPHHHSHAVELERVARFNPHVGFYDVHGRVCERMIVEDLMGSVFPVDPPVYEEILRPEFDLKGEGLPAYEA